MSIIEERRAQHNERMRRYRVGRSRSTEGKLYWQKNKEKILAKRKMKILTEKQLEEKRTYYREYARLHRAETAEYQATWKKNNRERINIKARNSARKRKDEKANKPRPFNCEICGNLEGDDRNSRIAFDHCHKTGKFRGWICGSCNKAIGFVKDDPNILQKMILYLESFTKRE